MDTENAQRIIPADIMAMSPDALIAEHRKIADHLTVQAKAFAEYSAPYKERQDFIENRLFSALVQMNQGKAEGKRASISTDAGTAYLSTIVTPKVVDKEKFLDWTLDNWDTYGGMLQIGAPQKAAFEEFQDKNNGALPPFTEISSFTRVNIRRS